jgi:hypothetical protein
MTNLDALKAEVEPYSLSTDDGYIKRLIDVDLYDDDDYEVANKLAIAKCAISILVSFLSLTSETLGPTAQHYDRNGLEERLRAICNENGLDAEDFIEKSQVRVYRNLF